MPRFNEIICLRSKARVKCLFRWKFSLIYFRTFIFNTLIIVVWRILDRGFIKASVWMKNCFSEENVEKFPTTESFSLIISQWDFAKCSYSLPLYYFYLCRLFLQSPANPDLLYIIFFCHTQLTVTLLLALIFGSKVTNYYMHTAD